MLYRIEILVEKYLNSEKDFPQVFKKQDMKVTVERFSKDSMAFISFSVEYYIDGDKVIESFGPERLDVKTYELKLKHKEDIFLVNVDLDYDVYSFSVYKNYFRKHCDLLNHQLEKFILVKDFSEKINIIRTVIFIYATRYFTEDEFHLKELVRLKNVFLDRLSYYGYNDSKSEENDEFFQKCLDSILDEPENSFRTDYNNMLKETPIMEYFNYISGE